MSLRSELRDRLAGAGGSEPLFLADLTGWYRQNVRRAAIIPPWQGLSLHDIYRSLGLPIWDIACPWREVTPGLDVFDASEGDLRTRAVETGSGNLVWRWEQREDGWHQVSYPIAGPADLPAAVLWARALSYALDTEGLTALDAGVGSDGLLALELPSRPLIQLAGTLIGWERAPQLLNEPAVAMILDALDAHVQELVTALAQLSSSVQLSPDDLDESVVSPELFRRYLLSSYRTTTSDLAEFRKALVVRTHGAVGGLLVLLREAGIAGLTSVGAPDEQFTLGDLSARLGERVILWGGIPAQVLSPTVDRASFEQEVRRAAINARGHSGVLLGFAGSVPVDADLGRLSAIPQLIRSV
jgi:hypothetical protein